MSIGDETYDQAPGLSLAVGMAASLWLIIGAVAALLLGFI